MEGIEKTRELISLLSKFFHAKMVPVGIIVCSNAMTASVDLTDINQKPNSNIIIQRSGTGKTTLLRGLHEANPDYVIRIPSKVFESSIIRFPEEYYQNKVWVHYDLITAFQGASTKQRQQLEGFLVDMLDHGVYERYDRSGSESSLKRVEGNISFLAALSEENFSKYGRETYYNTLIPQRMVPIGTKFDPKDLQVLMNRISLQNPSGSWFDDLVKGLRLPFRDDPVPVKIDEEYLKDLKRYAIELQIRTSMSMNRAYLYLIKMAKGHALLNERDYVTKADIEVLKYLIPAHRYPRPGTVEEVVRDIIVKEVFTNGEVSSTEIYKKVREIPGYENVKKRAIRKAFDSIKEDVQTKRGERNMIIFYIDLEP